MIAVVFGTTGELIKLAPVLRGLGDRGAPPLMLCTGQQVQQIPTLLDDFGLPQPDVWLARGVKGRDLERRRRIPLWLGSVLAACARHGGGVAGRLRAGATRPLMLVHGDTFTTVLGAAFGRALRVPVAHLEAGMRSGDWRHPFPEELDRLAVARLADVHLAPGAQAVANLEGARGEIVDTGANTVYDALALAPAVPPAVDLPDEPFGLVSLHRTELLGRPAALGEIMELLRETSRRTPLLFVDHPVTVAALASQGLDRLFDERLGRIPRQRYFNFISLFKASSFLVTDSGGSQEESAALGQPCLVHRSVTEHRAGLDGPVVLSRMDIAVVADFLADPARFRRPPALPARRPTDVVIDHLAARGFI